MLPEPIGLRERLAWCLWLALVVVVSVRPLATGRGHSVVPIYLQASRDWLAGEGVYGLANRSADLDQFRYAPVFAIATMPLTVVPAGCAELVWRALGAIGLLAGFAWFAREFLPDVWQRSSGRALLLAVLLPLSIGSLNNGQVNVHVVALLLIAVTAVSRQRWNLAAVCLTVSILCKLYPASLALLLVLRRPWPLGWRLVAMLAIGLGLPFVAQSPEYVTSQYRQWLAMLGADDRRELALGFGYRDLDLLLRSAGVALTRSAYLAIQLGAAGALAVFCWTRSDDRSSLRRIFDLACCWMILLGPATESCTYVLLAAPLAGAIGDAGKSRALAMPALVLFSISVFGTGFGAPKAWMGIAQVTGALLLTCAILRSPATRAPFSARAVPAASMLLVGGVDPWEP